MHLRKLKTTRAISLTKVHSDHESICHPWLSPVKKAATSDLVLASCLGEIALVQKICFIFCNGFSGLTFNFHCSIVRPIDLSFMDLLSAPHDTFILVSKGISICDGGGIIAPAINNALRSCCSLSISIEVPCVPLATIAVVMALFFAQCPSSRIDVKSLSCSC